MSDVQNIIFAKDIVKDLQQGDRIRFKSIYHNKEFIGRIEVNPKTKIVYFVHEFNYDGETLTKPQMRYYNSFEDFYGFDYFEKLAK